MFGLRKVYPSFFFYFRQLNYRAVLIRIRYIILVLYLSWYNWLSPAQAQLKTTMSYSQLIVNAKWYEALENADSSLYFFREAIKVTTIPDSIAALKLSISNQLRVKGMFDESLASIEFVDNLIRGGSLSDKDILLKRGHALGKLYTQMKQYDAANKVFEETLASITDTTNFTSVLIVRILNYNGIAYFYRNEYEKAIDYYQQAKEICYKESIQGRDLADVYENIAIIMANQTRYDSAYHFIQLSKRIKEKLYEENDQRMKSFYLNYARLMLLFGEVETSLGYNQKAEALLLKQSNTDNKLYAKVLLNIGNAYLHRSDYEKAEVYYRNTLNLLSTDIQNEKQLMVSTINNLAFVNLKTGNNEEALSYLKQIIDYDENALTKGKILRNLANAYAGLNEKKLAVAYFEQYIDFIGKTFGEKHPEYALSNIDFADYLMKQLDHGTALKYLQKAERIYSENYEEKNMELMEVLRKMAVCSYNISDFSKAKELFEKTDSIIQKEYIVDSTIAHGGSFISLRISDFHFSRADFFMHQYKYSGSIKHLQDAFYDYEKAISTIDGITIALSDESRLMVNENLRFFYQRAIESAYRLYEKTSDQAYLRAAFKFNAKSKAVLLMSSLRKNLSFLSGVTAEIAEKERRLNQEIQTVRKLVSEERQKTITNPSKIAFLEKRQSEFIRKYDSLLLMLESNYPDYYAMRFNPTISKVEEVQSSLSKDELMIEYMLGDSSFYIFAMTRNHFVFHRAEGKDELLRQAVEFRKGISQLSFDQSSADLKLFIERSSNLYNLLLRPVTQELDAWHLIIVPDGILGYLPFELLIQTENPAVVADTAAGYGSLPYLFLQHPVSYMYSSGMRLLQPKDGKKASENLLAFVPDYSSGSNRIKEGSATLPPLPFALAESERVVDIWDGDLFKGKSATKQRFLDKAGKYQVLHLAMHAHIDDQNPLYSKLVFQQQDSDEKTMLETYELYGLNLQAELVVLSACNTGSGQLRLGEGVMSLSRGFLFAGVPSIVMTGWEVHDKSGSELTERFYNYIKQGLDKDVAMQKAKIDYLKEANLLKSHPFFWASYMVVGDTAPVIAKSKPYNKIVLLLIAFVFVSLLIYSYKRYSIRKQLRILNDSQ